MSDRCSDLMGRIRGLSFAVLLGVLMLNEAYSAHPFTAAAMEGKLPDTVPFQACFKAAANRYDLPLRLLAAVATVESGFDPLAQSDKEALGVMQIRWPGTARHLGIKQREALFNPCISIEAGARYLRELTDEFIELELALIAYYIGPSSLRRRLPDGIPEAGIAYNERVIRALRRLEDGEQQRSNGSGATVISFAVSDAGRLESILDRLERSASNAEVSVVREGQGWRIHVKGT